MKFSIPCFRVDTCQSKSERGACVRDIYKEVWYKYAAIINCNPPLPTRKP